MPHSSFTALVRALRALRVHALGVPALVTLPALVAVNAQRPTPAPTAASSATADSLLFNGLRYRMIGPFRGGRSTAVAGIAEQPHTFLVGATGGGVWKTDDAGMTWRNVTDGFFGGSIGAIDVADSDPNVIVVGTGSADIRGNSSQGRGVWKSTDGGRTWSFIGLAESGAIRRVTIHPGNPRPRVRGRVRPPVRQESRATGIFRWRDGGKTWDHVLALNDSTGASDLEMDPRNPRILYAGMWRAERKPWAMLSGGPDEGVYKSTDGGDTWKKLAGGLPRGSWARWAGRLAGLAGPRLGDHRGRAGWASASESNSEGSPVVPAPPRSSADANRWTR